MRQLEGDVDAELLGRDSVEDRRVLGDDGACLGLAAHPFTEQRRVGLEPLFVQPPQHDDCLVERLPRDEAARPEAHPVAAHDLLQARALGRREDRLAHHDIGVGLYPRPDRPTRVAMRDTGGDELFLRHPSQCGRLRSAEPRPGVIELLVAEGWAVTGVARSEETLAGVTAAGARAVAGDVTDQASVRAVLEQAAAAHGRRRARRQRRRGIRRRSQRPVRRRPDRGRCRPTRSTPGPPHRPAPRSRSSPRPAPSCSPRERPRR